MIASDEILATAFVSRARGTQADLRNCVSRAYYAMYHAARPVADRHFPDPQAHLHLGAHERLRKRFKTSRNLNAKRIGYVLEHMSNERRKADYDFAITISASQAAEALDLAQRFSARLAACGLEMTTTMDEADAVPLEHEADGEEE